MPVVPANMRTVVDESICEYLAKNNYFYIMHRFDTDNVEFVKKFKTKGLFSSISLGVKESDYQILDSLAKEALPPDYITIDIAHGHADSVRDIIKKIK